VFVVTEQSRERSDKQAAATATPHVNTPQRSSRTTVPLRTNGFEAHPWDRPGSSRQNAQHAETPQITTTQRGGQRGWRGRRSSGGSARSKQQPPPALLSLPQPHTSTPTQLLSNHSTEHTPCTAYLSLLPVLLEARGPHAHSPWIHPARHLTSILAATTDIVG